MIKLSDLAERLADEREIPFPQMLNAVEACANELLEHPELHNPETGELTEAGCTIIASAIAISIPQDRSILDELESIQADLDLQPALLKERAAAVREALNQGIPVSAIAKRTRLSRERIYQIRDGRR